MLSIDFLWFPDVLWRFSCGGKLFITRKMLLLKCESLTFFIFSILSVKYADISSSIFVFCSLKYVVNSLCSSVCSSLLYSITNFSIYFLIFFIVWLGVDSPDWPELLNLVVRLSILESSKFSSAKILALMNYPSCGMFLAITFSVSKRAYSLSY